MGVRTLIQIDRAAFREVSLNSLMLALQYGASALVPLILVPHIVRTVGVATFGNIAVALAWATFGGTAVQYAFQLTGPKRVAQMAPRETPTGIFAEISLAKVVLFVCVVPVVGAITYKTVPADARAIDMLIILALPAAAVLNSAWYLQALNRFVWISAAAAIGSAAALWYGFHEVVDVSARSIWAAAGACVLGPLIAGAGTMVAAGAFVDFRSRLAAAVRAGRALKEGWPLFASQFVATLYGASGPIFISHLSGDADAGAYGAVDRFVAAIMGLCLLAHTAAYPRLANTYGQDRMGYRRLLLLVVGAYTATTACLAIGGWAFHTEVERFLLGKPQSYSALLGCGLVYLVVGVFGTAVTGYLTVSGRAHEVLPLTLKVLAISFVLGIPAALLWGGAGWMASRVLAQIPVLTAAMSYWREERGFR